MNVAKICQQQILESRNYQITSYFGGYRNCHNPNTRFHRHGTLQFKRHPSSSFNSKILRLLRTLIKFWICQLCQSERLVVVLELAGRMSW